MRLAPGQIENQQQQLVSPHSRGLLVVISGLKSLSSGTALHQLGLQLQPIIGLLVQPQETCYWEL